MVLAGHSRYVAGFPPSLYDPVGILTDSGLLGVQFFFVISGFLITWLLLLESRSNPQGEISLKNFYVRRILRIFPVYFFFLAALASFQFAGEFKQSRGVWLSNLTFTTNFFGDGRVSGHLWSLAIEEQFYLIWPGLVLLLGLASNLRRAICILSVPVVLGPISRILVCKHYYPAELGWFFHYQPTTSHFDSIAFGCASALLLFGKGDSVTNWLKKNSQKLPFICILLIGAPLLMVQFHLPGRLQALLCQTMQEIGFSLLLLDSITVPERSLYRFLNQRLIMHIGVLSYSIYIWQQIFCNPIALNQDPKNWWMSFPGWILAVLVAAHLSYYCLEMPFFKLRKRFRSAC